MRAIVTAVRGAVCRRRVQSVVVGLVVLLSTATSVLAVGLLVVSDAPFDHDFVRRSGAHETVAFDTAVVGAAALRATATRPGVSAAAGPFDAVKVGLRIGSLRVGSVNVVGRADQGGPVDRLSLDSGRWLTGPGQIVVSRRLLPPPEEGVGVGSDASTVAAERAEPTEQTGQKGTATLRVVGVADSITDTADAWVWPTQRDVLHAAGAVPSRQLLYRFSAAGDAAALEKSLAGATAGLPRGAVIGSSSYLAVKLGNDSMTAPMVPFVVAFAVLGLVMAVLIVANVVGGAVVAGYRTIGVTKSIGFTPGQVVAVYAGQVLAPGLVGCLVGLVLGNALALPIMSQTQRAYDVTAAATLPLWVTIAVGLVLPGVVGCSAVVPAWRAGRFSAVQAISVGRAPRAGRGYRVRRRLAATPLPRPIGFGLGTPFARPGRAAMTLLAILIGAVTAVFALGLAGSLSRAATQLNRTAAVPVAVHLNDIAPNGIDSHRIGPNRPAGTPRGSDQADAAAIRKVIQAQPGTAHVVGTWDGTVQVAGTPHPVVATVYDGDSSWAGYGLIAGRWCTGPNEVVAGSRLLRATGKAIGDTFTVGTERGRRQVRVVGEVFDTQNVGHNVIGPATALSGVLPRSGPEAFEVGLTGGTDAKAYVSSLNAALAGRGAEANARAYQDVTLAIMLGLVATLTILLSAVAALGVFNTVVLNTRERAHEIGVLKSIGMTPFQVRTMVVSSTIGIGVVAGLLAVPLGYALHHRILPVMGDAAGTGVPASVVDVYSPTWLAALAVAGVVLAVLGALVPAGWAARSRAAIALRAE